MSPLTKGTGETSGNVPDQRSDAANPSNVACIPGKLVPKATKVIAVTASVSPIEQPKPLARSPMMAVSKPITIMLTLKQSQPPP
ncbi:unnamed protein product [Protopolystoma xenopodis]|uniref:Uncharacterized protein n=1 Tax=Protopolystoma xenopodis TaxID=117903 RepID=A0A3S5FCA7_9PLAT|nr:unnamed protein product [Protopolystoma xenopodis]